MDGEAGWLRGLRRKCWRGMGAGLSTGLRCGAAVLVGSSTLGDTALLKMVASSVRARSVDWLRGLNGVAG